MNLMDRVLKACSFSFNGIRESYPLKQYVFTLVFVCIQFFSSFVLFEYYGEYFRHDFCCIYIWFWQSFSTYQVFACMQDKKSATNGCWMNELVTNLRTFAAMSKLYYYYSVNTTVNLHVRCI